MELVTLSTEIMQTARRLQKASEAIFKLGKAKAESERQYRAALMKEMLILKTEGMSVTMIGDIARGRVADLLFERDFAEVQYKSAIEAMDALRANLSALQSLLKFHQEL